MKQVKFLLLCFCSTGFLVGHGQKKNISPQEVVAPAKMLTMKDEFVKLSGEAKLIDSQYILILTLSVSGKNEISIDKYRNFDHGEYTVTANRLFLSKQVWGTHVHLYPEGIGLPMYHDDWDKKIKVTSQRPMIDTLNIAYFYPLEIGEYAISVEEDYWNGSSKRTAQFYNLPFTVAYVPKEMH